MASKEYIIFCDESDKRGRHFSNFYGGLIVGASDYERVTHKLEAKKQELNLFKEVKWERVTDIYLSKYKDLVDCFFDEVAAGNVRVRIMFTHNARKAVGLTSAHLDSEFVILYYEFIKHAFGLSFIEPEPKGTRLRLYFDQFPDNREKRVAFEGYLLGLAQNAKLKTTGVQLHQEDITEVRSHDHVLMQCLDIVLGSMSFRLNDKHKEKPEGQKRRGKRTIAKEKLYKHINRRIRQIYPGFNIGTSTGGSGARYWTDSYRHWMFVPSNHEFHHELTKK